MARAMGEWRRWAALVAALVLFAFAPALADEPTPALSVEFAVQPDVLVSPGEVTMTFALVNLTDLPVQNIYLSSADGLLSEPVGQLGPGERQILVRPHTVTQEELDAGSIDYTVSHDPVGGGTEKAAYALSAAIVKSDAQPSVGFTRQLSSDCATRGGLVTVTYKIVNTGNVALSALRIRDGLGDFTGRLERLDVGEAKTFISRVTLTEDAESAPVLEYAMPSGAVLSRSLAPAPIRIADSSLDIAFSVGQSVFKQDTADAILILTNSGNVDYSGITVLDDIYGGVIADAVSLPVGSAPVEVSHTYPIRGEGEYRWHITGVNAAGETLDLRTDTLTLSGEAVDPSVDIALVAAARTPRINRPGRVTFDFSIENRGAAMARDGLLYEINRGEIRRLAVLPAGEPTVCSAAYDIAGDEQLIFCLNYTDEAGRQRTVTSAPIDVTIAADGASPERVEPEGTALGGRSVRLGGNTSTFIVLLVIAGVALTVMLTVLVVTSARAHRDRLKRAAVEKQRLKAELGKSGPAAKKKSGKSAAPSRREKPE